PLAETMMMLGFFLAVLVEQAVLTFRKEKPSFIDLETFKRGGSEAGSDSEYDSPFIANSHRDHRGHGHLLPSELTRRPPPGQPGLCPVRPLRLEGLALGLQEEGPKLFSLFLGVAIHETLAAVALGASIAKAALPMRDAAKLATVVSLMIPSAAVGMGIERPEPGGQHRRWCCRAWRPAPSSSWTFLEILARELEDKQDRLLKVLFLILGYAVLAGLVFVQW
ncbi:zinc transporter ZIP3-like, partial [Acipenser oxyrinchus oxyrinchus]